MLEILKSCLDEHSFYGRGAELGPEIVMTDNCAKLREALSYAWPSSKLLLCVFHLLQQVWRWLFDKKHGINQKERREILLIFKTIVYEMSEERMEELFFDMLQSDLVRKYRNLVLYLETIYDYRSAWAKCYRCTPRIRVTTPTIMLNHNFWFSKMKSYREQRKLTSMA